MTTEQKVAAVRKYRQDRYEQLVDAVYKRRGWTENGVPKEETLKKLGVAYTEVLEVVRKHGG
jgi:aldehyde:ferredoxin oxidoreductase